MYFGGYGLLRFLRLAAVAYGRSLIAIVTGRHNRIHDGVPNSIGRVVERVRDGILDDVVEGRAQR